MRSRLDLARRSRAAGLHLLISAVVAAAAAALVFGLWYPGDYRVLSGGRELFFLVVAVDVVLGPLLTFAVFNVAKGWSHLRRDLAVIAALQLAALGYGMHTVFVVRPVAMVFEVDRFRIITALDVRTSELDMAPDYSTLPLTGPWLLGTRAAREGAERNEAIFLGVSGIDLSQRPTFWQPYAQSRAQVIERARPVRLLIDKYPSAENHILRLLTALNVEPSDARFLPLMARGDWVVLLSRAGDIVGVLPLDGFF